MGVQRTHSRHRGNDAIDPDVWTSRALQVDFAELTVSGLASMYPAFDWSVWCSSGLRSRNGPRQPARRTSPAVVPRRHDFFSAQSLQLSTDGSVIVIHHLCPTRIAQPRGFFGGPDDIDKQDCGERSFELGATIGGSAPDRSISSQRLIAMVASPRDCGFCIVLARCTVPQRIVFALGGSVQ